MLLTLRPRDFNSLSPCLPSDNTVISGDVNGKRWWLYGFFLETLFHVKLVSTFIAKISPFPEGKGIFLELNKSNDILKFKSGPSWWSTVWLSASCITSQCLFLHAFTPCLHPPSENQNTEVLFRSRLKMTTNALTLLQREVNSACPLLEPGHGPWPPWPTEHSLVDVMPGLGSPLRDTSSFHRFCLGLLSPGASNILERSPAPLKSLHWRRPG